MVRETQVEPERALIVGVAPRPSERWREAERLEELASLVEACGAQVFEKILQIKERPDPAFYIGKGKAEEIREIVREYGLNLVVVDAPLSGSQTRNLEELLGVKVLDRTEVIMDIFALHARTPEAKVQVELAQLRYQASKLRGAWPHLSRTGGGIGTRGPGEKQLELDRRKIYSEIRALEKRLAEIERSKEVQRRRRQPLFNITLVGYTNAGKSTLMNALTQASQEVSDQPFTTLDPLTRVLKLKEVPVPVLLTDTVGFIEDLPPELVASFKATLDVVREADLLLVVSDASHPEAERRLEVVLKTLEELGAGEIPRLILLNKIDLLLVPEPLERLRERYSPTLPISARTGEGLGELRERIAAEFRRRMRRFKVELPYGDEARLALVKSSCIITAERYGERGVELEGWCPPEVLGKLEGEG